MENSELVDSITAALEEIRTQQREIAVAVDSIGVAVLRIHQVTSVLNQRALSKRELQSLESCGQRTRSLLLEVTHGARCTCYLCMPQHSAILDL